MRLLFIRHGDPNYENDTLTNKGKIEAQLLADYIGRYSIDEIYVSPLGRAQDTATYTKNTLLKKSTTLNWLQEFPGQVNANLSKDVQQAFSTELVYNQTTKQYAPRIMWDILPSYYANHPELFDVNKWKDSPLFLGGDVIKQYDEVITQFDSFILQHGYKKNGLIYNVEMNNSKTIAFFCHYGITSILLARLLNISPFIPLQFTALAPTSITEVVTEERQKGIGIFRTLRAGDISHLSIGNEEPSFSARFCETFENTDQRH